MPAKPAASSLLLLLLAVTLHSTAAYYSYRLRIPNGERVPNPCQDGTIWEGVGHQNPAGAGLRNPFGLDFAANGFKWTEQLCRRDSDGDGATNGAELGDPDCVWSPGATPARTTGISHPGLCPLDSSTCTNNWQVCPKKFECPALDETGVYVRNFTLNETVVPPKETSYMCQAFELNSTAEGVHMIGSRPIIRNKNVMHHMIIYACNRKPAQNLFDSPQSCFMGNSDCSQMVNLWTFGVDGECFDENAGVLIGGKGYRYALLELHWNNPEKISDYKDSSGFSLYLTNKLRKNHQGSLMYGELELNLPPKQPLISYNHTCPGGCTKEYHSETRYITWATIHMHQFGVKGRVTLMRNGRVVSELVPVHNYDYNSPLGFNFNPPIEFRPGDEVKTECYYSTKKANESVFWGYDTNQEMCFAFIHYYPNNVDQTSHLKLSNCYAMGGINQCMFRWPDRHVEAECNVTALRTGEAAASALAAMANNNCFVAGCHPQCRDFLTREGWPSNACFDPKRSRRMAEVLASLTYLALAPNRTAQQQVSMATAQVLYRQAACERELQLLAQAPPVVPTTASPTQTPMTTKSQTRPPVGPESFSLSSNHFVIIIVSVCLSFALAFVTLGVVAKMKMRSNLVADTSMNRVAPVSSDQSVESLRKKL